MTSLNYKNQLSLIVSLIGLRILILFWYTFSLPALPGLYTPYLLILYALFDALIICYLYHFVRRIKKQKFSLFAILLIVFSGFFLLMLNYFFPFDTSGWSQLQLQLIPLPAGLAHVVGKLILAVQLIRNKAADSCRKYMMCLGWTYIVAWLLDFVFPFTNLFIEKFSNSNFYAFNIGAIIPLFAMILLYAHEWKQRSEAESPIGGSAIDSEL